MTIWVIAAVAVVVLLTAALVWWTSGRAKPLGRRQDPQLSSAESDHMARSQGGGFGIGSIG